MPLITRELLRKKAEHNEGMLSTLEEISLHQLDIEKISGLDVHCRHLKILYLQDNLIEKMEGLSKLKELEYVNLAVNGVGLVEGVRGCESLQKLDLTLNFVDVEDLEESMDNLAELPDFRELYLIGNPALDWEHCKDYVVARLPHLGRLDGDDVTKTWKLKARQNLEWMTKELVIAARKSIEKKVLEERHGTKDPNAYSKEFRRECYEEKVQKEKDREQKAKETSMFKEYHELQEEQAPRPVPVYGKDGRVRQANQGKYEWRYDETPDKTCVIFEIKIPKYMDTQLINCDLQPEYVRLDIKGRTTQLTHPEEILLEKSKLQRSTTTGVLCLTMPKANITDIEAQQMRIKRRLEQRAHDRKLRDLEKQQEIAAEEAEALKMKEEEARAKKKEKHPSLADKNFLIKEEELDAERQQRLDERKKKFYEEFKPDFDMDEVPDLE